MRAVLEMLAEQGFRASGRAAPAHDDVLRSPVDLARRLLVVKAVASWVAAPEERVPGALVTRSVLTLGDDVLGTRERAMLQMPRDAAHRVFLGQVGWAFEGAWALAWALGYQPVPDLYGTMMGNERVIDVLWQFVPALGTDPGAWVADQRAVRGDEAIAVLEGALEHVEAASRSGKDAVPAGFLPSHQGRAVGERRRALTWALTPGSTWEHVYSEASAGPR